MECIVSPKPAVLHGERNIYAIRVSCEGRYFPLRLQRAMVCHQILAPVAKFLGGTRGFLQFLRSGLGAGLVPLKLSIMVWKKRKLEKKTSNTVNSFHSHLLAVGLGLPLLIRIFSQNQNNVVVCPHPDPYIMAENVSQLLQRLRAVSALLKHNKQLPADIVISRAVWRFFHLFHPGPH